MAASAASAMASVSSTKKKAKKTDEVQSKLRTSADLLQYVENDKSHLNHFWEGVKASVFTSNNRVRARTDVKISEIEAADSKSNQQVYIILLLLLSMITDGLTLLYLHIPNILTIPTLQ